MLPPETAAAPTQRHSSPPDSQSSLRHGMGVRNAFLRNCLLPPASLSFRGILMGFLTKTRLFRDKGCYRLASHDDFDGRRQHWLEVKAPPKMLSTHYSSAEKRTKEVTLRTQNGRNGKSLMGDAGCLDLRRRQWRRVRALRQQNAALNYHLLRTAFHCGGISRSLAYPSLVGSLHKIGSFPLTLLRSAP